jgi:AcrR family transcriptional regulator
MTEHQRRRALALAIEVFARKGYPATTVDDLVDEAGIGVGSFYALFGGKEECLLAAHEEIADQIRRKVVAAAVADSWPEQICQGLRQLLDLVATEPARVRVALVEIQTAGPAAVKLYESTLEEAVAVLARGRELEPASRRLPETLEQTTVNGIAWLLHRSLVLGESSTVPELYGELGELVLEPYLGEERAREAVSGPITAAV